MVIVYRHAHLSNDIFNYNTKMFNSTCLREFKNKIITSLEFFESNYFL